MFLLNRARHRVAMQALGDLVSVFSLFEGDPAPRMTPTPELSRQMMETLKHLGDSLLDMLLDTVKARSALGRGEPPRQWPRPAPPAFAELDQHLVATLVDLARANREADFRWLAMSQGVAADNLNDLWRGARARVGRA